MCREIGAFFFGAKGRGGQTIAGERAPGKQFFAGLVFVGHAPETRQRFQC